MMKPQIPKENAFNFLRYALALSLIVAHYTILCDFHTVSYFVPLLVVQGFFIFSGFLTLMSHDGRPLRLRPYLRKRALRLVPPYATAIVLCALAGAAFTTLSPKDYATSTDVCKYVLSNLCFLNFLKPSLPGVFTANPHTDAVNGSLWTMKVEVIFYLFVPLLLYFFRKWGKGRVLLVLLLVSLLWNETFTLLYIHTGKALFSVLRHQWGGQLLYFVIGMALYVYFNRLQRYEKLVLPLSTACFVVGFFFHQLAYVQSMAYGTLLIVAAYRLPALQRVNRLPNLTYGLYLYHFPVVQSLLSINVLQEHPYSGFLLTLLVTTALAAASYYGIERLIQRRFLTPRSVPATPDAHKPSKFVAS